MIDDREKPTPRLRISDWVIVKPFMTQSRVVDLKFTEDGFRYGVLDYTENVHYFKSDELVKLVMDT